MKYAFFGSSQFSVLVLEELKKFDLLPNLIVTVPDKPKGRKLILTPNPTKQWAVDNKIKFVEFKSLKDATKNEAGADAVQILSKEKWDIFLVASYGKIIPAAIFNIPKHQTLNIHPSLLPKYRGASPIISQILNDEKEIGTSIMVIDEGMDTGPVITQRKIAVTPLLHLREGEGGEVLSTPELEKIMARESVELFVEVIDKWLVGKIEAIPQNDSQATTCGKIEKEDGLLDLNNNAQKNLLKIKAFAEWPRAYFFTRRGSKEIRVIITDATLDDSGNLKILKVIPEGRPEMPYDDFLHGFPSPLQGEGRVR